MMQRLALAAALLLRLALAAALLVGCASDGVSTPRDDGGFDRCAGIPELEVYAPGLSLVSEPSGLTVSFVSARPAPPLRGDNSWKIRITDKSGKSLDSADVSLTPTMPTHGHGTSPPTFTATHEGDGVYSLPPVDLFMPGPWRSTFTIDTANTRDYASVWFCIDA